MLCYYGKMNSEQESCVNALEGVYCVTGHSETCKTSMIIRRVKNLVENHNVPSQNITVITPTKETAESIQANVRAFNGFHVNSSRIWELCFKWIRTYRSDFELMMASELSRRTMLENVRHEMGLTEKDYPFDRISKMVTARKSESEYMTMLFEQAPESLMKPSESANHDEIAEAVFSNYLFKQIETKQLDSDDLIFLTIQLLKNDVDVLAGDPNAPQYILIDEIEYFDESACAMIKQLQKKYKNLYVTGDPNRALHRQFLDDFEQTFSDCKMIELTQNFHRSQDVVSVVDRIADNLGSKHKTVPANLKKVKLERVAYQACNTIEDENIIITKAIFSYLKVFGTGFRDIAVICRSAERCRNFTEHIRKYNFPYVVHRGKDFFNTPEINSVLSLLKLVAYESDEALSMIPGLPCDCPSVKQLNSLKKTQDEFKTLGYGNKSLLHVLQHVLCNDGFQDDKIKNFVSAVEFVRENIGKYKMSCLIEYMLIKLSYMDHLVDGNHHAAVNNIQELIRFIDKRKYETKYDLRKLLVEVTVYPEIIYTDMENAVHILPCNLAQNNKFNFVIYIDAPEEIFPATVTPKDTTVFENEKKLAYTAFSCSKDSLFITACRNDNGMKTETTFGNYIVPNQLNLNAAVTPED
jgi:ATP-dependent DNA helicase UvrD/PcrA